MTSQVMLLDTHALYWLVQSPRELSVEALALLDVFQADGRLLVSPISAWEISVAAQKRPGPNRPDLGGQTPRVWFRHAVLEVNARVVPLGVRVAEEAAEAALIYGRKGPGDCFLIATARVRRCPIVTRDGAMLALARKRPDYLSVVPC